MCTRFVLTDVRALVHKLASQYASEDQKRGCSASTFFHGNRQRFCGEMMSVGALMVSCLTVRLRDYNTRTAQTVSVAFSLQQNGPQCRFTQ